MEASDQSPTSDDLFDVSVEVRITCKGVPGPDPKSTAEAMVMNALEVNPSIDFSLVDTGEPEVAAEQPATA